MNAAKLGRIVIGPLPGNIPREALMGALRSAFDGSTGTQYGSVDDPIEWFAKNHPKFDNTKFVLSSISKETALVRRQGTVCVHVPFEHCPKAVRDLLELRRTVIVDNVRHTEALSVLDKERAGLEETFSAYESTTQATLGAAYGPEAMGRTGLNLYSEGSRSQIEGLNLVPRELPEPMLSQVQLLISKERKVRDLLEAVDKKIRSTQTAAEQNSDAGQQIWSLAVHELRLALNKQELQVVNINSASREDGSDGIFSVEVSIDEEVDTALVPETVRAASGTTAMSTEQLVHILRRRPKTAPSGNGHTSVPQTPETSRA